MLGTTLGDIRSHVESLASADGRYYLVCARHGDRPVPADGLRFETRETARAAARAAEQYRTALRRYDPRLPHYDVVVCQERQERLRVDRDADPATPESVDSLPTSGRDGRPRPTSRSVASPANARRVEFCHRVAAAVFEALSGGGHDAIESAVVDEYFELAERVTDLDDLCLCLLESIATEISRGLAPDEQARVVEAAASRLPTPDVDCHPAAATLASLRRRGMVGEYDWSVPTDQQGGDGRTVVVRQSEYALTPRNDRLPVLPVVVELVRHGSAVALSSLAVLPDGDGWEIRVGRGQEGPPSQLASARIRS